MWIAATGHKSRRISTIDFENTAHQPWFGISL